VLDSLLPLTYPSPNSFPVPTDSTDNYPLATNQNEVLIESMAFTYSYFEKRT